MESGGQTRPSKHPSDIVAFAKLRGVRCVGFDMDGVLFGTRRFHSFTQIGVHNALSYIWHTGGFPHRVAFFDSLRVPELERDTKGHDVEHQGTKFPTILTCWQCGFEPAEKIERAIVDYYDSAACPLLPAEKALYKEIAHLMLHPETFVESRKVLEEGHELVARMEAEISDVILFGVTNWDHPSFKLLQKRFPEMFEKHLRFVVISGDVGTVKPHEGIFREALRRLQEIDPSIEAKDCMFIDDEACNVNGARAIGMQGWVYA